MSGMRRVRRKDDDMKVMKENVSLLKWMLEMAFYIGSFMVAMMLLGIIQFRLAVSKLRNRFRKTEIDKTGKR